MPRTVLTGTEPMIADTPEPNRCEYLFVYGTLIQEFAVAQVQHLVSKFEPVGRGRVQGTLLDRGDYPAIVLRNKPDEWVVGEVVRLKDDAILVELDAYEEIDPENPEQSEFVRCRCIAQLEIGESLECWIYCLSDRYRSGSPIISSGDYRDWIRRKETAE